MKITARLLLLVALGVASSVRTMAADRTASARSSGGTYVRLADWARANQFAVRWLERNRTLQLSNRRARLVFNVDPSRDTRRAQINGVQVWLAFPLRYRNGTAVISQVDLDRTLTPVLSPARSGSRIRRICLDPGHGGRDPGLRFGTTEEQKYTLLLAREVREELRREGFEVILTRNSDTYVPLETRAALARKAGADLFVSLHFNSTEQARTTVKGCEVYCCTPAGATSFNAGGEGATRWVTGNRSDERNMLLAYQLQKSLVANLAVEDRGVKRARFLVLRDASMPAVLIEAGFLSHPVEGRKILDPAYRSLMARAVVKGILAYRQAVAPPAAGRR